MKTKQLPYSIECEQSLLWSILFDNSILWKCLVEEKDFYDSKHSILFKLFKALYINGKCVDPSMIADFVNAKWIEKDIWWLWYIFDLDNACTHSEFWKSYDTQIKEHANRRNIILQSRKLEQIWFEEDTSNILSEVSKLTDWFAVTKKKWCDIIDLTNKFTDFVDEFKKRWSLWYKWPYSVLENYIPWIIPWKVYTIVAYSNVWKSNFAYTYVVDALKKWKKVLFFSLEVQEQMLFAQLLKSYYDKNFQDISKDDFEFNMEDFSKLTIYSDVYDLNEICSITEQEKPDVIFIDFIQNVKAKWQWDYEKMTEVAQELQRLSIKTNATIFNISQANNDSRFKDSDNLTPKWSWAIFASSDIILWLSRDWENLQLNIMKNKYWMNNKKFLVIPDFRNIQFKITEELQEWEKSQKTDYSY